MGGIHTQFSEQRPVGRLLADERDASKGTATRADTRCGRKAHACAGVSPRQLAPDVGDPDVGMELANVVVVG
jgi:hypothetical protein